jgi:glutamate carboxypeptidase
MLDLLRELVELESPTYDEGVRAVAERLGGELEALGGEVVLLGPEAHLQADFPGEGGRLLVLGHTDTVWERGTLARMPFRVEDGRAYGPGAYDMKAGLVVALAALQLTAGERRRPVRLLLTADEEMATRTGRAHLEAAAQDVAAALVLEPCLGDGSVKLARKGLGRFRITVHGKAAHAGTVPSPGVSAIEELAHQVIRLHALADEQRGISVNVGVVRGGTRENVVAERAEAEVDVRVWFSPDLAVMEERLAALEPQLAGTRIELSGGWTRPPLEPTDDSRTLYESARRHALELGLELGSGAAGGGSDGNLVAALGVPVLDGLGPAGSGAHAENEHVLVASLPLRAQLLARLLVDPGL